MNSGVLPRDILAVALECAVLLPASGSVCVHLFCYNRDLIVAYLCISGITLIDLIAPMRRFSIECLHKTGKSNSLELNVRGHVDFLHMLWR